MDAYTGEIRVFAGNYAPQNWAFCNGQIINVQQNTTLFAIIGNVYGGNGTTNFALPNLQGQIPMGTGTGPGLTPRVIGDTETGNTYTIPPNSFPHTHVFNGSSSAAIATTPANGFLAVPTGRGITERFTTDTTPTNFVPLAPASITPAGAGGAASTVSNMQPYLALNFIICLYGNYPPKP